MLKSLPYNITLTHCKVSLPTATNRSIAHTTLPFRASNQISYSFRPPLKFRYTITMGRNWHTSGISNSSLYFFRRIIFNYKFFEMPAAKIFLTGASVYIGGSFLTTLLKYPNKYEITALVRNKEHAEGLRKLGGTPVLGSLDDRTSCRMRKRVRCRCTHCACGSLAICQSLG